MRPLKRVWYRYLLPTVAKDWEALPHPSESRPVQSSSAAPSHCLAKGRPSTHPSSPAESAQYAYPCAARIRRQNEGLTVVCPRAVPAETVPEREKRSADSKDHCGIPSR